MQYKIIDWHIRIHILLANNKQSNKFLYRIQKLSYIEHNVQVSSILIIISLWQQIYKTRKTIVHRSTFHPAKHFPSYT